MIVSEVSFYDEDEDHTRHYGKKIIGGDINEERIILEFEGGQKIQIYDDGQSCCETRYISCDDDISVLFGQVLREFKIKEHKTKEKDSYGVHEMCFVDIQTDQDHVQFTTHNEHNGYYGGFTLRVVELKDLDKE